MRRKRHRAQQATITQQYYDNEEDDYEYDQTTWQEINAAYFAKHPEDAQLDEPAEIAGAHFEIFDTEDLEEAATKLPKAWRSHLQRRAVTEEELIKPTIVAEFDAEDDYEYDKTSFADLQLAHDGVGARSTLCNGSGALPHQLPVQQVRARQPKKKKPRKKTSQAGNVFGKHGIPPETGDLSVGKKDKHPSQKDTPLDQLLIYADDTPEDIIRKMRGRRLAIRSIGSLSR